MKIAYGINELRDQYNQTSSGHWFDQDTMRFFKSRLTSNYKRLNDWTALFITTECGPDGQRKASIRVAKLNEYTRDDGRICYKIVISTVGEFQAFNTIAQAKSEMNKIELVII